MTELIEHTDADPSALMQLAVQQNVDVASIEKLSALYERWQDRLAKRDFEQALVRFQSECPRIVKRKTVDFHSKRTNTRVQYSYATLAAIQETIQPLLTECGLSYRWEPSCDEAGRLGQTCILTHSGGHSERCTLFGPTDESGMKSALQAIGSTFSFLKRYTLVGVLGITTADEDVDGDLPESKPAPKQPERVTQAALVELFNAYCTTFNLQPDDSIKPDFLAWSSETCGKPLGKPNTWSTDDVAECHKRLEAGA